VEESNKDDINNIIKGDIMMELKKLTHKLTKLEREFESMNTKAVVVKARLLKKARSIEKKIAKLRGVDT